VGRYRADPARVYVAGMSAGGAMACVLARLHGSVFAACAVHSGLMYGAAASLQEAVAAMRAGPPAPVPAAGPVSAEAEAPPVFVPTLVVHGDCDNTVDAVNAERIVEQARALAEMEGAPARPLEPGPERRAAGSGLAYRRRDYTRNGRIVVRKIIVEGLGHAWSGGDGRHPHNDPRGPDASRLVWEFLREFRREPGKQRGWLARIRDWLRRRN
jgi:poly(3-hydroxybutyrate) depolymerase